jgi:hypothetical protein
MSAFVVSPDPRRRSKQPNNNSAGNVQLPKTDTRRGATALLVLVARVDLDPTVPGMLAWQGKHYRPGITVQESDLLSGYRNHDPLVLELTEIAQEAKPRRRWTLVKILWQYRPDKKCWAELARMYPPASYEETEMRKLAARILEQDLWRNAESIEQSAGRIEAYLTTEMYQLGSRRIAVVDYVLSRLVCQLVNETGFYRLAGGKLLSG